MHRERLEALVGGDEASEAVGDVPPVLAASSDDRPVTPADAGEQGRQRLQQRQLLAEAADRLSAGCLCSAGTGPCGRPRIAFLPGRRYSLSVCRA